MELNSNYRKRRLLEDTVTSSNSSSIKRDASTSTLNNKPMTLDMWTQTEGKDETTKCHELASKVDQIAEKLAQQEIILEEIRDHILRQSGNSSTNNVEYQIVTNEDGDDITIEQVKPNEMIEERLSSPRALKIVEKEFETPTTSSHYTSDSPLPLHSTPRCYGNNEEKRTLNSIKSDLLNPSTILHVENQVNLMKPLEMKPLEIKPLEMNPSQDSPADDTMNMVTIGPNGTTISSYVLDSMDWSSSSVATRKLLTIIFSRETLATHSLTGRPSPAFHGREKPLKNKLDSDKVKDIIHIVSKFCNVSVKEVRNAITTKCADENKMFNQRLRKTLKERNKENFKNNTIN